MNPQVSLKMTRQLWFSVSYAYRNQCGYFLVDIYWENNHLNNRTCCNFPPHLTSICTLHYLAPQDTCKLHLFPSILFAEPTERMLKMKTYSHYHVAIITNQISFTRQLAVCIRLDLGRKYSILVSVTTILNVHQVCHGVGIGHCVRNMRCSLSSLEWKILLRLLARYLELAAAKHVIHGSNSCFSKTGQVNIGSFFVVIACQMCQFVPHCISWICVENCRSLGSAVHWKWSQRYPNSASVCESKLQFAIVFCNVLQLQFIVHLRHQWMVNLFWIHCALKFHRHNTHPLMFA